MNAEPHCKRVRRVSVLRHDDDAILEGILERGKGFLEGLRGLGISLHHGGQHFGGLDHTERARRSCVMQSVLKKVNDVRWPLTPSHMDSGDKFGLEKKSGVMLRNGCQIVFQVGTQMIGLLLHQVTSDHVGCPFGSCLV